MLFGYLVFRYIVSILGTFLREKFIKYLPINVYFDPVLSIATNDGTLFTYFIYWKTKDKKKLILMK